MTYIEDVDLYIDISIMQFRSLPINISTRYYTSDSDVISDKQVNIKNLIMARDVIDEIWCDDDTPEKWGCLEDNELPPAEEAFRIGWQEMLDGKLRPISEIWNDIDINK